MTVMTESVARLLLPVSLVIAVAVLVKGYADTGDGFTAGVIAALGVLLQYVVFPRPEVDRRLRGGHAATVALGGLALALLVAFTPLLRGDAPLTHLPTPGAEPVHVGSLELITAVAFDVGIFALVLGASVTIVRLVAVSAGERRS